MDEASPTSPCLPRICVERCSGLCCNPWWGIIAYSAGKDGALANLSSFRSELIAGLRSREARIRDAYATAEAQPRRLFKAPERYNLIVKNARANGRSFSLDLVAMFAFRCLYLAEDNACSIHPTRLAGRDIRPPHCARLGTPDAREGEEGFCRVVHAAVEGLSRGETGTELNVTIDLAAALERATAKRHYEKGFTTPEEAVDAVMERIERLLPRKQSDASLTHGGKPPGRNDPCPCGSGQKFKKCHGR